MPALFLRDVDLFKLKRATDWIYSNDEYELFQRFTYYAGFWGFGVLGFWGFFSGYTMPY